jgi:hypothetical protein
MIYRLAALLMLLASPALAGTISVTGYPPVPLQIKAGAGISIANNTITATGVPAGGVTALQFGNYTTVDRIPRTEAATAAQGAKADTALQPGDVVNTLTSAVTTVPLSAAQGKVLQDSKQALLTGVSGFDLNSTGAGDRNGVIDLHASDLAAQSDYSSRIIRSNGDGGLRFFNNYANSNAAGSYGYRFSSANASHSNSGGAFQIADGGLFHRITAPTYAWTMWPASEHSVEFPLLGVGGANQGFAQWLVTAGPTPAQVTANSNGANWGIIGNEINTFERYADAGYMESRTGRFSVATQIVPESELSIFGGSPQQGYHGSFGILFGHSDTASPRTFPAAKWHVPLTVQLDATAPNGVSVLLRGGSDADNDPTSAIKIMDFQTIGIDTSAATMASDAIRLGAAQTIGNGTNSYTLAELAAEGGTPGGSSGQIQYNNGGSFDGFGGYNNTTGETTLTSSSAASAATSATLIVTGDNNKESIAIQSFNASPGAALRGYGSKGSRLSPSALVNTNLMFGIYGYGWNGTAFGGTDPAASSPAAAISMSAGEAHTTTAKGSYIDFQTTANTTATRSTKLRIHGSGGVSVGSTTDPGAGVISASAGVTAPTLTSTVATGTAPLVVASATNVANLNASSLGGATFAAPGAIGGTTPAAITGTTITGKQFQDTAYAPSAGSVFTIDLSNGMDQELTTSGNVTITLPTPVAGKSFTIAVKYGGTHTVTWAGGGTIKWSGGAAPTATSVSGKYDIYVFKSDATSTYTMGGDGGRNY